MLAGKLLELATLIGVSQSEIARHVGVTRSQVNLWARNKQEVSKRYRAALLEFLFEATKRALADLGGDVTGHTSLRELDKPDRHARAALRTQILAVLYTCTDEAMELSGDGPTTSVASTLEALDVFRDMAAADMRKPLHAAQLETLAARLLWHAERIRQLGPLFDLVNEENPNAYDRWQPGACDDAGTADSSAH